MTFGYLCFLLAHVLNTHRSTRASRDTVMSPGFRLVLMSEIWGRYSWYQRSRFKFRMSGVELRRSNYCFELGFGDRYEWKIE